MQPSIGILSYFYSVWIPHFRADFNCRFKDYEEEMNDEYDRISSLLIIYLFYKFKKVDKI